MQGHLSNYAGPFPFTNEIQDMDIRGPNTVKKSIRKDL